MHFYISRIKKCKLNKKADKSTVKSLKEKIEEKLRNEDLSDEMKNILEELKKLTLIKSE